MKKVDLTQRYQTEKAIIDALLKISEIVKKTGISRQNHMLMNTNSCSKKTMGDGDTQRYIQNDYYDVPIPPPMRTFNSYVSDFNQQYAMSPSSNCNRASIIFSHPKQYNKRYDQISKKRRVNNDYRDRESFRKHRRYDVSSTSTSSNDYHRKKSYRSTKKHGSGRHMGCKCQTANDDNEHSASDC